MIKTNAKRMAVFFATLAVLLGVFTLSAYAEHSHEWSYAPAMSGIRATCANSDGTCNLSPVNITVTPPAATVYDGSPKGVTVSGRLPDMAELVITYFDTATSSPLPGAPSAVGSYQATVLMGTSGIAMVNYSITPKAITSVPFDVTAPVAGATPQASVPSGTGYTASITWRNVPETFGYGTQYVADVIMVADSGYAFSSSITAPTGWTLTPSETRLTFTRQFPATETAKVTAVVAPTVPTRFTDRYADAAAAINALPKTTTATAGSGTIQLTIQWMCTYNPLDDAFNTFMWSVADSIKAQYYEVAAGVATTGTVTVQNVEPPQNLDIKQQTLILDYGQTWADATSAANSALVVMDKQGSPVSGTWRFIGQTLTGYPSILIGTYDAIFTPDDTRTYAPLQTRLSISLNKADPAIATKTYNSQNQEASAFYPSERVLFTIDASHPTHSTWKVPTNLIDVTATAAGMPVPVMLNSTVAGGIISGSLVVPEGVEGKDINITINIKEDSQSLYVHRTEYLTVSVKSRNAVNNTATDKEVEYRPNLMYGVSQLFTIDPNAGTPTYTLISGGDIATLNGTYLSITGTGEIKVQLYTAVKGLYSADTDVATLTVTKIAGQASVFISSWNYNQPMPSLPTIRTTTHQDVINAATYHYTGKDNAGNTYDSPSAPTAAGSYTLTVTLPANKLYQACTASADFEVKKINPTVGTIGIGAATLYTSTAPSDVVLSIIPGVGTTPGTVKLADSVTVLRAGTSSYPVIFTPTDTCNYNEFTTTVTLKVENDTLQDLAVTARPTKMNYVHGDTFDPTGMTLTAYYSSGRQISVDLTKITCPTLSAGDTSVTLTWGGKSVELTGLSVGKATLEITGMSAATNVVYNGSAQNGYTGKPTSAFTGTYVYSYSTADGAKPVDAGSYTLIVSIPADNPYYTGSVQVDFEIAPKELTVSANNQYVTIGGTLPTTYTFSVSGLCGSDTLGFDPKLSCTATGADTEGSYPITITGYASIPNYTITYVDGTLYVSRASGYGSVTMDDWTYDGNTRTPSAYSSTNGSASSFYYSGTTYNGQSYSSSSCPTEAGTYTVTAYFDATASYDSCSASDDFTISRATPSYTAPGSMSANFGDKLADLTLPSGFSWEGSATTVGDAGTNTLYVTYTPADTNNYQTITGIEVTVTVAKLNISGLTLQLGSGYTYSGSSQSCSISLPSINGQTVTYTASGNTATEVGTYTVTVTGTGNFEGTLSGSWSISTVSMDSSSVKVTLGDALVYTGEEQTQTISSVRIGSTDIAYTVQGNTGTDVDVYYMTLYSADDGVTGSVRVKWTIAPDTSKIEGLTVENVTSADEGAIREVLDSIQSETAKTEWADVVDRCEELLEAIEEAASSLSGVLDALNGYDINTVKSSDKTRIERLADEIADLLEQGNLTDAEKTALQAGDAKADALLGRIDEVAKTIADVTDRLSKYDINTVKSTDKADITDILADVNKLLEGDNLTATERVKMKQAKSKAESLLDRIQDAYDQANTDNIKAAKKVTKTNAKVADRPTVDAAIKDLEAAISKYPGNYTTTERKKIDDELARLRELLSWLTAREAVEKALATLLPSLDGYDINTVKSSDKTNIEKIDAQIETLLTNDALTATEKVKLQNGATKADALLGRIDEVAKSMADITARLSKYDIETVKSTDKADIEDILADVNKLLDGDNLTATERSAMKQAKTTAEALLKRIQDAYDQAHTAKTRAAEKLDATNVKASDRATVEGAIHDLEKALEKYPGNYTNAERIDIEDELERLRNLLKTVEELEALEAQRTTMADLLSALDRYSIDTVKSSDQADIEDIKAELQQLLKAGTLNADDRAAIHAGVAKADALLGRISEVAARMQYIKNALSRYDIDTVKSSDKFNIENIRGDIKTLLDGDNLTSTERIEMQDADAHAVALLDRIQAAYDQAHTPAAEQAAQLTESTVQLTDRGTIESAIKDLNTAISLYPGNYTAVERKEIDNELARLADLLSKLDALEAVQDMINNLPTNAQPGDTAAKDAYDAAKEAYDQLGSREKAQINTEKLDALAGMLKAYAIIEGMDGVWVKESELETGLGFLANGPQAALSQILIDTTVLNADSYTVSAPSTTLTLNVDYLESLDAGVYKLTVRYADGEASCFFTVEEAPAKSFGWIWIILLILIALIGSGILCYVLYNKKEQKAAKE